MKICILTPRFPMPENGGDVLRINNIARYLKKQGHSLVLVSYYETGNEISAASRIYDKIYYVKRHRFQSLFFSLIYFICGKPIQCGFYFSPSFEKLLKKVIEVERPDMYISHLLRMTTYLEHCRLQNRSIVEMTDALSKTYSLSRNANSLNIKRLIYSLERSRIKKYEKQVIATFPKVVLVSLSDLNYFKSGCMGSSLYVYSNGVDCMEKRNANYDASKICFVGNMRTLQNQDAVIYFVNEIFPRILMKKPNAKFYVVGAEPSLSIRDLARKCNNVIVTGFVDSIQDIICDSCIMVAPVRIAAGIQNKVLVAMANGIPVVMTSLIAKAIPELQDGINCMICDEISAFAESCLRLMENKDLRNSVAKQGFEIVKEHYSWERQLAGYEEM